jgi:aspartokinase-like uncharacterized kinase
MTSGWRFGILHEGAPAGPGRPLVVKIGGSLLSRPGWPEAIASLMAAKPGPQLIVVGGGPVVDGLRTIDAAAPQPAAAMHWRAIEALGITARLVADAVGLPLVESPETTVAAVLDASHWLRDSPGLPEGWHVTSDSIAAVVAARAGGGLLLAKSVPPPAAGLHDLAAAGWIDAHFPEVAAAAGRITWAAPARFCLKAGPD